MQEGTHLILHLKIQCAQSCAGSCLACPKPGIILLFGLRYMVLFSPSAVLGQKTLCQLPKVGPTSG
jgi:hypothetical protein